MYMSLSISKTNVIMVTTSPEKYVERFKSVCIAVGGNVAHEVVDSVERAVCVFPMDAEMEIVSRFDGSVNKMLLEIHMSRKGDEEVYGLAIPLDRFTKIEIEESTTAFGKYVIDPEKNIMETSIDVEVGKVMFTIDRNSGRIKISIWS